MIYVASDVPTNAVYATEIRDSIVNEFKTAAATNNDVKYSKYDLNRDGDIDSKDVAYVLVSWDK